MMTDLNGIFSFESLNNLRLVNLKKFYLFFDIFDFYFLNKVL